MTRAGFATRTSLKGMCGRYAASASRDELVELFQVDVVGSRDHPARRDEPWLAPRWNIAPTDSVPAVLERADDTGGRVRRLVGLSWGLVPSWSRSAAGAARMINARLETVAVKPAFRKAVAERRCLLPADGYYEWLAQPAAGGRPRKQPYFIHPADGGLMVMAGLYEFWKDPAASSGVDPWLVSCSILTTDAVGEPGMIHDRMPVQVAPQDWGDWLDPRLSDAAAAMELVHVPQPGEMAAYAVSTLVSNVRNDGPQLVEPLRDSGQVPGPATSRLSGKQDAAE